MTIKIIFYIWSFEAKFYLESWNIVFVIFLLLSETVQVIIFTFSYRFDREKSKTMNYCQQNC